MLMIFEEIFLLALDDEKGTILPFAKKTIAHALSGGILTELTLQGKVCSNEKRRLEVIGADFTGDEILDETIREIQASEKAHKPSYWVSQLSERPKKLRERIGQGLVARDLVHQEEKRFFWRSPSPAEDGGASFSKFEMKNPLRAAILSSGESGSRDLALLNVAASAGLLDLIFTQDELSFAGQHIHEKVVGAALKDPVMQTIEEIGKGIQISLEDDSD